MSLSAEQNLKDQIAENKKRQLKISKILKETYQQFQAEKELDGCLNTLIAAIDFLQQEQKKATETNILIAKNTTEQAEKFLKQTEAMVSSMHPRKVSRAMDDFETMIDHKNSALSDYLNHKLRNIEARDRFMSSDPLYIFLFLFFGIGAIGGVTVILKFFYNLL